MTWQFYLYKRGAPVFNWGGSFSMSHPRNTGGEPLPVSVRSSPIVGYRLWRVRPTPEGLSLWSVNQHYEWQVDNTAECLPTYGAGMWAQVRPSPHDDPAPSLSCSCGFYCQNDSDPLDEWEKTVRGTVFASGTVALTGRVIRCELGFKAERATIESPVVLGGDCAFSPKCHEDVVAVGLQSRFAHAWCAEHVQKAGAIVEAAAYFRSAVNLLSTRYEPVEFISWV
jgi:hypothetical protein